MKKERETIKIFSMRIRVIWVGRHGRRLSVDENVAAVGDVAAVHVGDEDANDQDDQNVVDQAQNAERRFRYDVQRREQVHQTDQDEQRHPQTVQIEESALRKDLVQQVTEQDRQLPHVLQKLHDTIRW